MKTFIDIETTGLNKATCDIIQVATIVTDNSGTDVHSKTSMFLKVEISQEIERLTGISNTRLAKEGLPRSTFAKILRGMLENNPTFVGHNICTFDWPFIVAWLERHIDRFPTCPIAGLEDTLGMARSTFALRKWPKNREVAYALGVEYDESMLHGAEYDIELTRKVYVGLKGFDKFPAEERRKIRARMAEALEMRNVVKEA